jgi:hypothetical protein
VASDVDLDFLIFFFFGGTRGLICLQNSHSKFFLGGCSIGV